MSNPYSAPVPLLPMLPIKYLLVWRSPAGFTVQGTEPECQKAKEVPSCPHTPTGWWRLPVPWGAETCCWRRAANPKAEWKVLPESPGLLGCFTQCHPVPPHSFSQQAVYLQNRTLTHTHTARTYLHTPSHALTLSACPQTLSFPQAFSGLLPQASRLCSPITCPSSIPCALDSSHSQAALHRELSWGYPFFLSDCIICSWKELVCIKCAQERTGCFRKYLLLKWLL